MRAIGLRRTTRGLSAPLRALGRAERRIAWSILLWGLGEGLWMYIQPLYIAQLGGDAQQVGLALGIIALGPVLVMLPVGRLIDRVGPRRLMRAAWIVGLAGGIGAALAPDWAWLTAALTLYRISAFGIPALNAYVALAAMQRAAPGQQDRALQSSIATVNAVYYAGLVFSPVAGGIIGEALGLRAVFAISTLWFAASAVMTWLAPPLAPTHPLAEDAQQAAPVASGRPWWRFTAAQAAVYAALLALFFTMELGFAFVPTFLEDARGLPVGVINGLAAFISAGVMVWTLALGSIRPRAALTLCSGLMLAALGGLLVELPGAAGMVLLAAVYFAFGAQLTARTLALGAVSAHTPPAQRGTAFGLVEMLFGLGRFGGAWLAGALYLSAAALPFLAALALLLPLTALSWLVFLPPGVRAHIGSKRAGIPRRNRQNTV